MFECMEVHKACVSMILWRLEEGFPGIGDKLVAICL